MVKEGGAGEGGAEGGAEGGGGVRKNSMTSLMPRIARLVHRPVSRAELETLCMIEMFCSKSQLFSFCFSSQLGMSCMWCGDQLANGQGLGGGLGTLRGLLGWVPTCSYTQI